MHNVGNTFFSGYKPTSNTINTALLWDYDISCFDWQKSKAIVVQRVIERGDFSDFYAAFDIYGGFSGFREIIKSIPYLSDIDMNFVCHAFQKRNRAGFASGKHGNPPVGKARQRIDSDRSRHCASSAAEESGR